MLFNTPYWLRLLGGKGLKWDASAEGKSLYVTFDDGPNPETTPLILDMLNSFDAKASFFCVGENVSKHPETFRSILDAGHAVGNHAYNHLKGWKTDTKAYVENVQKCAELVNSGIFRPPYGKMKPSQLRILRKQFELIMWTVLSRDYDPKIDAISCLENSWKYTRPGAIVLFHDHKKTIDKLKIVLPEYLRRAKESGYLFQALGDGH